MLLVQSYMAGRVHEMHPKWVSSKERVWTPLWLWLRFKNLGCRLSGVAVDSKTLTWLTKVYKEERYMTAMNPAKGSLGVVLHPSATPTDMLKAYFHCVVFWEKAALLGGGIDVSDVLQHKRCNALLAESQVYCRDHFGQFAFLLKENQWEVDHLLLGFGPWRCEWDLSSGIKDE
ncbi:unnamed protein product [Choristocarpus tenellus]